MNARAGQKARRGDKLQFDSSSTSAPPRHHDAIIPTSDGSRLAAEVWRPLSPSRGAVVFVHGFCGDKSENGLFHALAAECSANGFHAVLYDWRGIARSQGNFSSTTLADHVEDFQQVVAWTSARFEVDSNSLFAVGFSLGAAVIGSALRNDAELGSIAYLSPAVRPSLDMWPRYDTPSIWGEIEKRGVVEKPGSSVMLGRPILASLRDTDLGPRAFDVKVPLLVCHGSADARIACSSTRKLVAKATAPHLEYCEIKGASHSFRPEERYRKRLASVFTGWLAKRRPPA